MNEHHVKQIADVGASMASLFVLISHWAEIATPILTFLIALATLGWWVIRYWEWRATGTTNKD